MEMTGRNAMTHRDRVLTSLAHRVPDRVPRTMGLVGAALDQFKDKTGATYPGEYWDMDFAYVGFRPPDVNWRERFAAYYDASDEPYEFIRNEYPPEWGIAQKMAGFYHFSRPLFPLKNATTIAEIENYPFPDYIKEWGHDHLEGEVERLRSAHYPVSGSIQRIFQNAWYLRSREQLFVDFVENPAIAEAIFERIGAIVTDMARRLSLAGVDILQMADDIGMQDRMMISPDTWRKWVKPYAARAFAAARDINPDIHIAYHTDGDFEAVMPDLIDIGVTVFSTVQPECMDVFEIKKRWGKDVTLMGTVGVQSTFRFGTPQEVKDMIRRQIEILGDGGGFVLATANAVEPDVPWENIVAFFEAADEYGRHAEGLHKKCTRYRES